MHGPDGLPISFEDHHGDLARAFRFARFKKDPPAPPAPPDPAVTAAAQAAMNKDTAIAEKELNMINQYTPYGNLIYTQTGISAEGTPQYSVTQLLHPNQQAMKDITDQAGIGFGQTALNQLGQVSGALGSPIDYSRFGDPTQANEQTRQRVAESMFQRMEPLLDRDRDRIETRLANQGITQGSDAYNEIMDEERRARTDARLAIENQALGQMGQMYGMEQGARNAAINELIQQRQIPLNELNAMLTQSQVQGPQFTNTPQTGMAPTDYMGAVYDSYAGQLQGYNQQMANQNSMMGGLFGLGSAALMAPVGTFKTVA